MFPISIIEGLASGSAYVSTDVGIVKYLPGGIVVNNIDEIPKAIDMLIENNQWKEKAKKGFRFVYSNCRQEIQVKKLETLLQEAVSNDIKNIVV